MCRRASLRLAHGAIHSAVQTRGQPRYVVCRRQAGMVRCATFEIHWHDTLPIYACDFQPIPPPRLAKVLDHNLGQGTFRSMGASRG